MATDPNATPADADDQPQAGTTSQADTPATDGSDAGGDQPTETISLEDAKKLRSEAANLRKRLKAFEEEERKRKDAERTEAERLAAERQEFEAARQAFENERRQARTASAVEAAARRLGFRNPAKAFRLLDEEDLGIEEDGTPSKAEEALKALAAAEPYLVGSGTGSPTNPARESGSTLTMEKLRSMSAAEIAKYPKAEVDAVLQGARS